MAFIVPHPSEENQQRWKIRYILTVGSQKLRRDKYEKKKTDAELLKSRLVGLENATKIGYASERDIKTWEEKGWITEEESVKYFQDYGDLKSRREEFNTEDTDLERVFEVIEEKSAKNSKGGRTGKTHKVRMSYMRRVKRWLEHTSPDLNDLTPSVIEDWKDELGQKQAQNTVRHVMINLKVFLDEAVSIGMLKSNPTFYVSAPRPKVDTPRRILGLDEIQLVKKLAYNHMSLLYGSLPIAVMLGVYAGLRGGEMAWLKWDAIEWDTRIINIKKTISELTSQEWRPKSNELRRIDVKEELITFLWSERHRQREDNLLKSFVIPNRRDDKPVNEDALQKAFKKMVSREPELCKEDGSPDKTVTLHALRHSYATWALRSGVDIETVRMRMGHADIKTTMEYLHYVEPEKHPMDVLPY